MKKTILALALLVPMSASAEYMDVLEVQLAEGCSFNKYMEIVNDFNSNWGEAIGYKARVAMPLQNSNLVSLYWLGTTKDAATFGKVWDTWRDGLADSKSKPAKLWARFQQCSVNLSRTGYDVY